MIRKNNKFYSFLSDSHHSLQIVHAPLPTHFLLACLQWITHKDDSLSVFSLPLESKLPSSCTAASYPFFPLMEHTNQFKDHK